MSQPELQDPSIGEVRVKADLEKDRLFIAGISGGALMSLLMAFGRVLGLPVNVEMMLGTLVGLQPGGLAYGVGLAIHLVLSGLVGLAYGYVFLHVRPHRAGWDVGLAWSIVHLLVAGLFMGILPSIHPLIPEEMAAPGFFMANLGTGAVVAFIAVHFVYGILVGSLEVPAIHYRGQAHRPAYT